MSQLRVLARVSIVLCVFLATTAQDVRAGVMATGKVTVTATIAHYTGASGLPEDILPDDIAVDLHSQTFINPIEQRSPNSSGRIDSMATPKNGQFGEGGNGWGVMIIAFATASTSDPGSASESVSTSGDLLFENNSTMQTWFIDLDISWSWKSEANGTNPRIEMGIGTGELTAKSENGKVFVDEGRPALYVPGEFLGDHGSKRITLTMKPGAMDAIELRGDASADVTAGADGGGGPQPVPEPSALVPAVIAAAMLLGSRVFRRKCRRTLRGELSS